MKHINNSKKLKKNMKGGLVCTDKLKCDVDSFTCEPIMIKMIGNNYCYNSVVEKIKQIKQIKQIVNNETIINAQWEEGVVVKTVDFQKLTTQYDKVTYESLYETKTETKTKTKASILRLFYNMNSLTETEFPPILVKEEPPQTKDTKPEYIQQEGGGHAEYTQDPKIVSDDYRRTILSVAVTQLTSTGFDDKHYILKMSSNENNTQGYKDEANIYEKLEGSEVYKNNVVKYYCSGNYRHESGGSLTLGTGTDSGNSITFSNEQWQGIFDNTESLGNEGFYILLENTLGYYDYEDYVKLGHDISKSFVNIYNTLKDANTNARFFHGDFHNNNVKINKERNVKLFDFDYSGILSVNSTTTNYISKNIQNYKLKYKNNLIFQSDNPINTSPNPNIDIDDLQKFLFWFDIFRMWLSTCKTLKKLVTINKTLPTTDLHKMVTVFNVWFHTKYDHQWHEYFMNDYFYKNIYSQKEVTVVHHNGSTSSYQNNNKSFSLSLNSDMEKTLVIGEKTLSESILLSKNISNNTIVIDAENPEFVFATSADLRSMVVNGQGGGSKSANTKTNYKKYGKFDVVLHNETYKMRVVWKYNRQFFIKRQNGTYEKISKKNIKM
jgi:hypothetical protein